MTTLTNITAITEAVADAPGHTAHWYMERYGVRVRKSWLYDAFTRAYLRGAIRAESNPNRMGSTVYFPADPS
jgi:hypothetical protein